MKEKLSWIYENLQRLQGVPVIENNIGILATSLLYLKQLYDEADQKENAYVDATPDSE